MKVHEILLFSCRGKKSPTCLHHVVKSVQRSTLYHLRGCRFKESLDFRKSKNQNLKIEISNVWRGLLQILSSARESSSNSALFMLRNFFSYLPSSWSKNRVKDFEKSESKISKSQNHIFRKNMILQFTFLVRPSVPSTPWCFDPSSHTSPRCTNQLDHHLSGILRGGTTGAD